MLACLSAPYTLFHDNAVKFTAVQQENTSAFLTEMPHVYPLTHLGWHVVVVYLLVMVILSCIVYRSIRDKLFLYYSLYAALLIVFLLTRNHYFSEFRAWYDRSRFSSFGLLIQVVYLSVYFRFGILFLKLHIHKPRFSARIFQYTWMISTLMTVLTTLVFADLLRIAYVDRFFDLFFLPLHVTLAGVIMHKAMKKPEAHVGYFLWGSVGYIVFALTSLFASSFPEVFMPIGLEPISYFFVAITLECTLFAVGLGKRIRDSLKEKYDIQAKLLDVQYDLGEQTRKQLEQEQWKNSALMQQTKVDELQLHVARLQTKMLRGQLNSHFIFNVLNSIKAFIVENQTDAAANYLGKFAKFVRQILDGSIREVTTLGVELETVLLYVDIENMRLSNQVKVTCEIEEGVDLHSITLPAMILQPFAENAIWHGLSDHSIIDKQLELRVTGNNRKLSVIVNDNGQGYTTTLHGKSKAFSKSHGLAIVREQIDRFNLDSKYRMDFSVSNREGGGTCVVISLDRIDAPIRDTV